MLCIRCCAMSFKGKVMKINRSYNSNMNGLKAIESELRMFYLNDHFQIRFDRALGFKMPSGLVKSNNYSCGVSIISKR